ncbi:MAG: M23 family metallopeptidase [Oscillospiraceae bacterium]|nr:M23 family metallopeptidase [Oscillospiraceae bacterium]
MILTDETESTESAETAENTESTENTENNENNESTKAAEISRTISAVWNTIFMRVSALGELLFTASRAVVRVIVVAVLVLISRILLGLEWLGKHLKRFFKWLGSVIYAPISRYVKALNMGKTEISKARDECGSGKAFTTGTKVAGRIIFGKRGILVTVANWVLPIVSCVFLFNIVGYANNQSYALKLTVNGSFMGYISDENVYLEASQIVQKRINYSGSHVETITLEPGIEVNVVGYANTLNHYQLADKMLELLMGADNIKEGYGLFIGDAFYGTLESTDKVEAALDELLAKYRNGNSGEVVTFDKEITYTPGLYLTDSFVDEDETAQMLTSYKTVAKYYTVVTGDAHILIANKVGMTMDELDRLNPGFKNKPLHGGDQLKITQEEPFLNVRITRSETYTESIPYETEYYEDSSLYEDNDAIKTPGSKGERTVVANVSYVNGVEVGRTVTSRTVTKEPVTEVRAIGTKPRPSNSATAPGTTIEAGKLLWPAGGYYQGYAEGGLISEVTYAHGGYYDHKGIDIVCDAWSPIYAAHNGYVLEVGAQLNTSYGRGNYVRIQGDDGLVTHYYHMIEWPSVYTGQRVTAGDVIGYVGSTGRSSANHLHFEVRYNGIVQYPIDYLPKHAFGSWCKHY